MRVTETSVKIFCIFDDVIMTSIWAFPNFWHSELISSKHDLQDLWSNNLIALTDTEIWASKDAWKSPKKRLSSIYLSICLSSHDNLTENGGSRKPPSRCHINLKFFLPSVQQWYTRLTKFHDPSSILTWFSRVLKLGIFGNRDKYVLLCWQV